MAKSESRLLASGFGRKAPETAVNKGLLMFDKCYRGLIDGLGNIMQRTTLPQQQHSPP
jgi:hypothetical protein